MDFYDEWLRYDYWKFEEAAMLFNDMDPQNAKNVGFKFYESNNMEEWKKPILKTYKLFLRTNWSDADPNAHARGGTHRDIFFQIALDKAIPFSDTLKLRYAQFINEIKKNKDTLSKGANSLSFTSKTLIKILDLVRDFEESETYKKYGDKTPQSQIEYWLADKLDTKHHIRATKEFITEQYEITTARRK